MRAVVLPLGLNLAAAALVGAVLAAGAEPGGLGVVWRGWLWPMGVATATALAGFRFPKAVGLPVVGVLALTAVLVTSAVRDFKPLGTEPLARAQPLTDRQVQTAFALRYDALSLPQVPGVPRSLYRLRLSTDPPGEWWWSWAQGPFGARSTIPQTPKNAAKLVVYQLTVIDGLPVWRALPQP